MFLRGDREELCVLWGRHCFAEIAATLGGLKQALHKKIKVSVAMGRFPCAKGTLLSTIGFEAKDHFRSEQLQEVHG